MDPNNQTQQQNHYTPSFSAQMTPNQPVTVAPPAQPIHSQPTATPIHKDNIGDKIEQIVVLSYIFVAALLLFRFALGLFGAQRSPFVNFVHDISTPFMIPFTGMFGPVPTLGYYSIEFEAIVALIVYALVFLGLGRLVKIVFK